MEINKIVDKDRFVLTLFVSGASPNSVRAISNLQRILEERIKGRYKLTIIDVHQEREAAEREQIIALPLLVKSFPEPARRLIGDMSNTEKVIKGLGIVSE